MKILALETSAAACSAALCQDGTLLAQSWQNSGLTHSRTLLPLVDSMLKNCGASLKEVEVIAVAAIQFLKNYECRSIKLMNILAAPEGIQAVRTAHPDVDIYVAAVDEKLNDHGYIVPGLGDAGDRIFGTK